MNIRSEGIRTAITLMDRASDYMVLSKDTAVSKVPIQHPWSAKLGSTGKPLERPPKI